MLYVDRDSAIWRTKSGRLMNLNQMHKIVTGVLLTERDQEFKKLCNFIFSKKKSEDKTRRVGSSAIFEKDFLQIVGSLSAARIKDADVQTFKQFVQCCWSLAQVDVQLNWLVSLLEV